MTFVGKIDQAGNCSNPGTYSDPYGVFDDAVVTGCHNNLARLLCCCKFKW